MFVGHPAIGSILGWPIDVLPVFQGPLCSLPVLAVATLLGKGELWLDDQQLRRVVPVAEGQRCMVGSKHLRRIQGDNAPSRVTAVLLSLPNGDDNASADACQTLDVLDLKPVAEAKSRGQQLVIASAPCPSQARVDVIVKIAHDYGWRLLAGGKPRLRAVRWPRLLEYLLERLDGQPVLALVSTWDRAKRSLLSSALASTLLRCHEAYNDVCHDLWSQRELSWFGPQCSSTPPKHAGHCGEMGGVP